MERIYRIIKYLFRKNNIKKIEKDVDQFFDNGVSFPLLVAISFNIPNIPDFNPNPTNPSQQKANNDIALQYLFQKNKEIKAFSPSFNSKKDKLFLLSLILKRQIFRINLLEIMAKCNDIIQKIGLHFTKKSEIISEKCILAILNVFTNGKVPIKTNCSDFDVTLMQSFKMANVPLVIDKTSLEEENDFLFLIQIEIIFQHFLNKNPEIVDSNEPVENSSKHIEDSNKPSEDSNKFSEDSNKLSEDSNKQGNLDDDDSQDFFIDTEEEEEKEDEDENAPRSLSFSYSYSIEYVDDTSESVLLETINEIGKKGNLHFKKIKELAKNDNIRKFILLLFKKDPEFTNQLEQSSGKVEDMIKLLGTKEPIFNIIRFNFSDPECVKFSIILLLKIILNRFFLKQPKSELFERFHTFIFGLNEMKKISKSKSKTKMKKTNHYERKDILFKWKFYDELKEFINALIRAHIRCAIKTKNHKLEDDLKRIEIPIIINQSFLDECQNMEKDELFYQLRFFFDVLDDQRNLLFIYNFFDYFFVSVKLIRGIKVPSYENLAERIKNKFESIIIQKKRYNKFHNLVEENEIKEKKRKIEDLNMVKKEKPRMPETFIDRYKQHLKEAPEDKKIENQKQKLIPLEEAEKFWNPIDNEYYVNNGVLYMNKEITESSNQWINEIDNYEKHVKRASSSNELDNLFFSFPVHKGKSKLYKFFHYNEQGSKWEINSESVTTFIKNKISNPNIKIPLILISNSYEKEAITLTSRLIEYLPPDLDEDDIYVYGLLDKHLDLLQYEVTLSDEGSQIKPIFLLLHVPKSKEKMTNIKIILYKIYNFLSIICDVEIVILNKYFKEQINLIMNINNIKHSYKESAKSRFQPKLNRQTMTNSSKLDSSTDDDDSETDRDVQGAKNGIHNLFGISDNFNLKCFEKQSKYIFLVNNENIKGDIIEVTESNFSNDIRDQIASEFCKVLYINVNDPRTYRCFLSNLYQFSLDVSNNQDNIRKNFQMITIANVSNMYINLKSKDDWKSNLKQIIKHRFEQMKESNFKNLDDDALLRNLNNEIMIIHPSIDSDFYSSCIEVLNEIKKSYTKMNEDIFNKELSISSAANIKYLTEVINGQYYWTDEKKDLIENSHVNFLKKEFYSILRAYHSKNDFGLILNANKSILMNQIENDQKIIRQVFVDLENRYKSPTQEKIDIIDEKREGANYTVKETEREKQIEAVVEARNWENEIEQDF